MNFKSAAQARAWLAIAFLSIIALIYCAPALASPFWGDNDTWSNVLPIIHYRKSILEQHVLPLNTDLWYGGRAQWQNPLWSFLYLPATVIWLSTPLAWGARLVFVGHLIFALLAGRKLSTLFLSREVERVAAAVIFTAPMLQSLALGQVEVVMAWGWLLLAIYFLLNEESPLALRGTAAGGCWGVMALAGANYHVFYAGILLVPLILSYKSHRLLLFFLGGSLLGLLHLPGVWHLFGVTRGNPAQSIGDSSIDLGGIITTLSIGPTYKTWAPVSLPIVYLFGRALIRNTQRALISRIWTFTAQQIAVLVAIVISGLLTTGALYQGHHLLDTFRTSGRAISLTALATLLYVLMSYARPSTSTVPSSHRFFRWLLIIGAIQVSLVVWLIQPPGSQHSPTDPAAQRLIEVLQADHANSVWLKMGSFQEMYIQVALTEAGIALPNVYYGDIGQTIPVHGPYCGYSFDHLISPASNASPVLEYFTGVPVGEPLPLTALQRVTQVTLADQPYDIYRIVCAP